MLEISLSIFLMGTLACEVALVIIVYRIKGRDRGGEQASAKQYKRRTEVYVEDEPHERRKVKRSTSVDLPPELIAPNIKNPPRPQGGFGSKVDNEQK